MARTEGRSALVLFGHGARDPEWRRPIEGVLARMREDLPDTRTELAFHEFVGPTLCETVAVLYEAGFRRIIVVPVFIAQGGHLRSEVPSEIESLRASYPDCVISLERAVGESPEVQSAIAAHCRELLCGDPQKE